MSKNPVSVLVIGCGARGELYSRYALENPDKMKVIAIAEPRVEYRNHMKQLHDIKDEFVFSSWEDVLKKGRITDAVLICTQDNLHTEPAIAFSQQKYHMLLEKPMSSTPEECREIVASAKKHDIIFAVCHVLRYTRYTTELKKIIDNQTIGDIISMQHLEPVGWWHQAHSFVRGNWKNDKESTFMLLAKACHDLDWIRYIMGSSVESVHSFGHLSHFTQENHPDKAGTNCFDCSVERRCPYSAQKIYLENEFGGDYFRKIITPVDNKEALKKALIEGPYGRCVYLCDNNVVDHQVVNFQFQGNKTASFTMTAFTEYSDRKTRIFGTRGRIEGDGKFIKVFDFNNNEEVIYDVDALEGDSQMTGHGGGDYYMMKSFIEAVKSGDQSLVLSGPDETLETHLTVFAAEQSRKTKTVINVTL